MHDTFKTAVLFACSFPFSMQDRCSVLTMYDYGSDVSETDSLSCMDTRRKPLFSQWS